MPSSATCEVQEFAPVAKVARFELLLLCIAGDSGPFRDSGRNYGYPSRRCCSRWTEQGLPFCQNTADNRQERACTTLLLQLERESQIRPWMQRIRSTKNHNQTKCLTYQSLDIGQALSKSVIVCDILLSG